MGFECESLEEMKRYISEWEEGTGRVGKFFNQMNGKGRATLVRECGELNPEARPTLGECDATDDAVDVEGDDPPTKTFKVRMSLAIVSLEKTDSSHTVKASFDVVEDTTMPWLRRKAEKSSDGGAKARGVNKKEIGCG